uniref:Uncharacterized protein n=1 Tax=Panagrolaimus sp. ES5 TaxID=591445 RepID=A0AC34FAK3_9BILA
MLNYTTYANGSQTNTTALEGCTADYVLLINDANWTFPINHCQHFQTNQTASKYQYLYGNVCNTRDNCTYSDNGDLVCAGFRTTPYLALFLMIAGCFIAKIFV